MVFIDGGWLYRNRNTLFAKLGEENFEIDYAKLPRLFCEDVANRLDEDVSLVRTNYFGTIPSARSGFNTSKQYAFYDFLERSCGYETDIHEVEVGTDENWIKMSLSAALLFYAAQPGAYDIAILIGDDPDYGPALRRARLFGKRIQIVGVNALKHKCLSHILLTILEIRIKLPKSIIKHDAFFKSLGIERKVIRKNLLLTVFLEKNVIIFMPY